MKSGNFYHDRVDRAIERQAAWAALSPEEQLKAIDKRLGEGLGAKKQRAKLAKKLEVKPAPVAETKKPVAKKKVATKKKVAKKA